MNQACKSGELVLITATFPYGRGEQFIETEIQYLSKQFCRIHVIPTAISGERRSVPENVVVAHEFAKKLENRPWFRVGAIMRSIGSRHFWHELLEEYPRLIFRYSAIRSLIFNLEISYLLCKYVEYRFSDSILGANTVHYSYWLNSGAMALAMYKEIEPSAFTCARAHGGDLYEERRATGYLPLRGLLMNNIDMIFPVSKHGADYLLLNYKVRTDKIQFSRLGVPAADAESPYSTDGRIRILSCSFLVPVKRVSMIIEAIASFAKKSENEVIWKHIGGGDLLDGLKKQASRVMPNNVSWQFLGDMKNERVFEYYRSHAVDLFLNLSLSEGVPVSMMEAQSCGVPIMATSVGGVPEIVNRKNGVPLQPNVNVEQVALSLSDYFSLPLDIRIDKRKSSLENWKKYYDAGKNYKDFCQLLRGKSNAHD